MEGLVSTLPTLSSFNFNLTIYPLISIGATIDYVPLKLIQIYFDTATYDMIEKDVTVTLEAQLGLIGGTMGLLTGFSILSGVEILYYVIKFFIHQKTTRK